MYSKYARVCCKYAGALTPPARHHHLLLGTLLHDSTALDARFRTWGGGGGQDREEERGRGRVGVGVSVRD